jgi:hypothetical protein
LHRPFDQQAVSSPTRADRSSNSFKIARQRLTKNKDGRAHSNIDRTLAQRQTVLGNEEEKKKIDTKLFNTAQPGSLHIHARPTGEQTDRIMSN